MAVPQVDIAIVGAGFGGLGMAIKLEQAGRRDFVVLDRAADVGGTWYANSYPGCQCDVPSNLYSFSFAPKHDWTHTYPEQPQILDYLRECVTRFGIGDRIRLNCELTEAAWDGEARRWRLDTSDGPLTARVLVPAPGLLSEPVLPLIPGLDQFAGTLFHSARWNHEHDLTGERVALLGTGASSIQLVPKVQPKVAELQLYQRTPPWIARHTNRPTKRFERRMYRHFPAAQRVARAGI